jgi:hypothetical protein
MKEKNNNNNKSSLLHAIAGKLANMDRSAALLLSTAVIIAIRHNCRPHPS